MKGIAVVSKGLEEVAAKEISELVNAKCELGEGYVIFEHKGFEDLCLLCYKSQSTDRIMHLLGPFGFQNLFLELEGFIGGLDLSKWLKGVNTFKVECIRVGKHDFKSIDVEEKVSKILIKNAKAKKLKADFKDYEIIFLAYVVENKFFLGIDFSGFELNKRSYKIFMHQNSIRGTIAYGLIRECGFEKKDVMLDPFSRDGMISIEAAFYATDFPLNYYNKQKFAFLKLNLGIEYEKLFERIDKKIKKSKTEIYSFDHLPKYVDFSRKNAKIAGVDAKINFSRVDLEWLDIKFKKESVDKVISNLPASKNSNLDKIYNEFFYQGEYILKKEGMLGVVARTQELTKKYAEKHNFEIFKEKDVWSGEQALKFIVFKKKNI